MISELLARLAEGLKTVQDELQAALDAADTGLGRFEEIPNGKDGPFYRPFNGSLTRPKGDPK